jgi:Zn-dependent alcohol dehydrogenase
VEKFGAPLVIKNVPVPTPGKDEVLIKVRHITCCLVCGVVLTQRVCRCMRAVCATQTSTRRTAIGP